MSLEGALALGSWECAALGGDGCNKMQSSLTLTPRDLLLLLFAVGRSQGGSHIRRGVRFPAFVV